MAYKPTAKPRNASDLQWADNQQLIRMAWAFLSPGNTIFPRAIAGEILDRVVKEDYRGRVAEGFNAFIIGVAVRRLVSFYSSSGDEQEEGWKADFLAGLNFNPDTDTAPSPPLLVG